MRRRWDPLTPAPRRRARRLTVRPRQSPNTPVTGVRSSHGSLHVDNWASQARRWLHISSKAQIKTTFPVVIPVIDRCMRAGGRRPLAGPPLSNSAVNRPMRQAAMELLCTVRALVHAHRGGQRRRAGVASRHGSTTGGRRLRRPKPEFNFGAAAKAVIGGRMARRISLGYGARSVRSHR